MSETGAGASRPTDEGVLYGPDGSRIAERVRSSDQLEPVVRFAKEKPFTMVILALGIGYLVGKIL